MSRKKSGEAIRLTNKTAKALREQAKREQFTLRMVAVMISIVFAVFAVLLGIGNVFFVPLFVVAAIGADALILMMARSRYVELTGQAICTESAARSLRGMKNESERKRQALLDLERIKADLNLPPLDEDEDEDLTAAIVHPRKAAASAAPAHHAAYAPAYEASQDDKAPSRRRRQANLQVIKSDN